MNQVSFKRRSDADLDRLENEGGELGVVRGGHAPMVVVRLVVRQVMDDTTYLLSDRQTRRCCLDQSPVSMPAMASGEN
jgi:hypothetical protein